MAFEAINLSTRPPQDPPEDSKLTRTKQRWAKDGRGLVGQVSDPARSRLPPGQHLVKDWPVLDLGEQPEIDTRSWTLRVTGLVEHPIVWDWAAFQNAPQTDVVSDIHCVTTWSRYDNSFRGVSTRHLCDLVAPEAEARFVMLYASDGYTTNLAIEDFAAPAALLAHAWEELPLTPEHGGPVRLILPHLYLWKSAKWLRAIEFMAEDEAGFWEDRGYHNRGDPWREERYSS
jgi:DMSO/TMAO reductase YedYZ molybdopterin-dependent catalytic subunit